MRLVIMLIMFGTRVLQHDYHMSCHAIFSQTESAMNTYLFAEILNKKFLSDLVTLNCITLFVMI